MADRRLAKALFVVAALSVVGLVIVFWMTPSLFLKVVLLPLWIGVLIVMCGSMDVLARNPR